MSSASLCQSGMVVALQFAHAWITEVDPLGLGRNQGGLFWLSILYKELIWERSFEKEM